MKTMIMVMILVVTGIIFLPGCGKESKTNVPISLTDKDGNIFIRIDSYSKSFDAYSGTRISSGLLKGVFNDTIRSSFYLAITTKPYWDSVYHSCDTIVFPTHYPSHIISLETPIDFSLYESPYHFLLLGIPETELRPGSHGTPAILLTFSSE
jgi:hypothetical protein